MSSPVRVAVTGAAGQIGYSLLGRIACGDLLGPETPVILQLLEITPALKALKGVAMELEDLASPLLRGIVCTDDVREAFREVSWALLVGAKPRGKGMERGDLIRENGPIFVGQGRALNEVAAQDVRAVVVGNPCNTNCLIAMSSAPDIPRERFSAMTRLDENRARTQLALKAGVPCEKVSHVAIWGNHSATQFPDFAHARIGGRPAPDLIKDAAWLCGPFIETVQKRGAAVIEARGVSSAMSAANALIDHVRALRRPTVGDEFYSCAVCSPGAYDVSEGLISSFPVRTQAKGGWEIVKGIEHDGFARARIEASIAELSEERRMVSDLLHAR